MQKRLDVARRRFYAALVAGQTSPAVECAFANVPREHFLGAGPWWTSTGADIDNYLLTPDDDPVWLCQDITFALNREQRIHNGQPSLHARCLSQLGIGAGQKVAHVGAGSGYYTAILAELAGAQGKIDAYEIDPALAARARVNLSEKWPTVCVHEGDGALDGSLPECWFDAIYVNASATGPASVWLKALCSGGRLLFPLTPTHETGTMLMLECRSKSRYAAQIIMDARFIPAESAQNLSESAALSEYLSRSKLKATRSLRLSDIPMDESCLIEGVGWWLSTKPEEKHPTT